MSPVTLATLHNFFVRTHDDTFTTAGTEQEWRDVDENEGYDGAMLNFLIELHAMEVTNSG